MMCIQQSWQMLGLSKSLESSKNTNHEKRRRKIAGNPITTKQEVSALVDGFLREEITVIGCRTELRKLPHYCKTIIAYQGRQVGKEDLKTVYRNRNIIVTK